MKHKVYLADFMEECPVYWQNFITSFPCAEKTRDKTWGQALEEQHKQINENLKPFNGIYFPDEKESLQFLSKEDAAYFILRWS
jgi:hypothetical protein